MQWEGTISTALFTMLSHAARVGGRFVSRFAPRGVAPRSLPCRAAPRGFASQAETSSQVWGRTGAALAFSAAGGIAYLASAPAAEAKSTVHPSSVPIQGIPGKAAKTLPEKR